MCCIHAQRLCQTDAGRRQKGDSYTRHPSQGLSRAHRTQLLSPQNLTPASGWAQRDSRVTKHFFQFLVNREILAHMENTAAPLCFSHVTSVVSLFDRHCRCRHLPARSGGVTGAPARSPERICRCTYTRTNSDTQNCIPSEGCDD